VSNKSKSDSPLVKSVLALDNYVTELERIGGKINSTDMTADFDVEYVQKLMGRFAECSQGVSNEVTTLSTHLHEAQIRAVTVAQAVSRQAELFTIRRNEQNVQLEKFGTLGERVRELNAALGEFRFPPGHVLTDEDRAKLAANAPAVEAQLASLIDELQDLGKSARESRMKALQKNVESLAQALQAARKKLRDQQGLS
jgi:hypothetical protein